MRKRLAFLALLSWSGAALAQSECVDAQRDREEAREGVADALRAYAKCFAQGGADNDCGAQFARLAKAQKKWDSATLGARLHCRANRFGHAQD